MFVKSWFFREKKSKFKKHFFILSVKKKLCRYLLFNYDWKKEERKKIEKAENKRKTQNLHKNYY